ncbi:MAG: hypothetical protein M3069_29205 [Chloroflexota bacterium]|nr:hypothetical protein [Chloroflexota bacterium]
MTNDDMTRALNELIRAQWDPTAPLPFFWPAGVAGVLLMFVLPLAAGIPFGVIMAREAGLSPLATAGVYLISDLILAMTAEPFLALLRWLGKRVAIVGRMGQLFARATDSVGLSEGRVRGPLGLILFSFSISPTSGRAAAAAAGHGFVSGWTLAIIGDMLFFGMLMVTTLWVTSVFGDNRQLIGALAIGAWILPMLIRRLRRGSRRAANARPAAPIRVVPASSAVGAGSALRDSGSEASSQSPRRRLSHSGRRRPSRGLRR